MKTIISKILPILYFVPIVFAILVWFNGAYHGSRRHEIKPLDEGIGFFQSFYYGLESFWHPLDYNDLKDNIKLGVFLISEEIEPNRVNNSYEYIRAKKAFRKYLKVLNEEETVYLKKGVNSYIVYFKSITEDMFAKPNLDFRAEKQSVKTKIAKEDCFKYGLKNEILSFEEGIDLVFREIRGYNNESNNSIYFSQLNKKFKSFSNSMNQSLNLLFNIK